MIDETFERFRFQLGELLGDFQTLVSRLGNAELHGVVSDLRTHVSEPALFVVVGEIKAGKSSFINALLGETVCEVDPAPCTDVIQQIGYGRQREETRINDHVKRLALPVDVLRQIAIVDTPGTNTIMAHHQEITERFIPNAGLVLFVFPAKNPHTRSAWEMLNFVTDAWRKRVVFVLQQADLTTEAELSVNLEKVREYAGQYGVASPQIFVTSARWESEGDARSGFDAIRTHIRDAVTGGRHLYLKLRSTVDTCHPILEKILADLEIFGRELEGDRAAAEDIEKQIAAGRRQVDRDSRFVVDRLLERYDGIAGEIRTEFESRLAAPALFQKALGAAFKRKKPVAAWIEELQKRFETRLVSAFEDVVGDWTGLFGDTLKELSDGMAKTLERIEPGQMPDDRPFDLMQARESVIAGIRRKVGQQAGDELIPSALSADPSAMGTNLVGGGALTLIGAILLATTHVAFLDITGGILTGAGLFLAGGALMVKRGRLLRELDKALAEGRERFEGDLSGKLSESVAAIFEKIRRSVTPLFDYVQEREEKLGPLTDQSDQLRRDLARLSDAIDREATGSLKVEN
jgi:GTPase SAR1 family protein